MSGRPLDVLEESLGEAVLVRLKSGEVHLGVLGGYDQHMNVVLDPSEDLQTAPESAAEPVEDTTIIRGDNVVSIIP